MKLMNLMLALLTCTALYAQKPAKVEVLGASPFTNGELWLDEAGKHINAHGGNIIKFEDTYYWTARTGPTRVSARRWASRCTRAKT